MNQRLPTIGFIGTGAISTALVTGFCERASETPYPIVVSPRNRENAAKLKAAYPERVTVAESMQEVLDRSDWVVLAVLPKVGEEVCRSLRFRPEHKVINLLSDMTLPQIRSWIGETETLLHMVPLTFNAFCDGPIVLCPPDTEAAEIFGHVGEMVQLESRYQTAVFAAVTGFVTPFFSLMYQVIRWANGEGVPLDKATKYVTGFFNAVCEQAVRLDPDGVQEMAEVSTPGGVNYMVKEYIANQNGFELWSEAMGPVMDRIANGISKDS